MLVWEDGYKIGHEEMDGEHLTLIALLNQLDIGINNDAAAHSIVEVIEALDAYLAFHFAHEEALMHHVGYPNLNAHIGEHHSFTPRFRDLCDEARTGNTLQAALKVRGLVIDWLLNHILTSDADYARFIAEKN
ncbi:MAG: bacteriohemerythrin [Actinomycetota bacterium]